MYPKSIYFGLKVLPVEVRCSQSIYYLGTWTLILTGALLRPFKGHYLGTWLPEDLPLPTSFSPDAQTRNPGTLNPKPGTLNPNSRRAPPPPHPWSS